MSERWPTHDACPLCGSDEGCPPQCPSQEWPPRLDGRLIVTRTLIGLGCFLLLTAMAVPNYDWQLGMALAALACVLLYGLLRLGEMPTEAPGKVTSKGCCGYRR